MRKWKPVLVALIAGLLLGVVSMRLVPHSNPTSPLDGAQLLSDLRGENADLLVRLGEQDLEMARLRAELANLRQAVPPVEARSGEAEEPAAETAPQPRSGFFRRMEERMGQRVDEMAAAYGLNEEQRERLAEALRMQFENIRARRNGEDVERFNLDEALSGILTPEQFEQYLEESQQEIYNRAELIATTQLVRLNQSVELQPGQEELVYDAVHYTAQEMMISRQSGEAFDMRQVMEERLGTILTEEQMQAWRERPGPGRGMGFGP
jgi:hypothetical protein